MTSTEHLDTPVSSGPARVQRHIITSEYYPQPGGVSDYAKQVAEGLANEGEEIHVWCPETDRALLRTSNEAVLVHRELGQFMPDDLKRLGERLDTFPAPRRILVQWVPHGYGRRSMNLPFCTWLWRRAKRHGDVVEVMVHEAFLTFSGSWRQHGAALVHRLMTVILIQAASCAYFSASECQRRWESFTLGRRIPLQLLPVPSNIGVKRDEARIQAIRRRYSAEGTLLLGHFGTYGAPVLSVLEPIVYEIGREIPNQPLLLLGRGSLEFRDHLVSQCPAWEKNLHATGPLTSDELSCYVSACDLLIQPYPDGATTRRTSLMVGLSHGKPIVTTKSPVTEPLWEQSGAVGLTGAGDTTSFVKLLGEVLKDPKERARLSEAACKLYQENFDISHTVAALRASASKTLSCAS